MEDTIVIELKFNEVGTKIKTNDFLDKVVSQIQSLDVGGINGMLLNRSDSTTDVIDFLSSFDVYLAIRVDLVWLFTKGIQYHSVLLWFFLFGLIDNLGGLLLGRLRLNRFRFLTIWFHDQFNIFVKCLFKMNLIFSIY